ncbi:hypothetical protein GUJ93_ZPchr0010g10514 [Zizania palustris]|uniref:Uncharacterized protein n=1 Tax=Zizania palustris TaxID=103762 RepID=A0A8J5WCN3_ZIZPA|nr:hypothetical protein GUJ93_ZPchr0010g10514 [Zizania palustris]
MLVFYKITLRRLCIFREPASSSPTAARSSSGSAAPWPLLATAALLRGTVALPPGCLRSSRVGASLRPAGETPPCAPYGLRPASVSPCSSDPANSNPKGPNSAQVQ